MMNLHADKGNHEKVTRAVLIALSFSFSPSLFLSSFILSIDAKLCDILIAGTLKFINIHQYYNYWPVSVHFRCVDDF